MDDTPAGEAEPRAAMQAEAVARLIRQEDVTRLMNFLRVLEEVSEGTPKDAENDEWEEQARRFVTETAQRLKAFADICGPDDPILMITTEWDRFFKLDNKARGWFHFRVLQWNRIRAMIELAERVRQLLAAKCREQVDVDETAATVVEKAATVVNQRDIHRLGRLANLLNRAVRSSLPDLALAEDVRDVVSKIWQRMEETAATKGEDATLQELLPRWRELRLVDVQKLVRNKADLARALALVRDTEKSLNSRRPAARRAQAAARENKPKGVSRLTDLMGLLFQGLEVSKGNPRDEKNDEEQLARQLVTEVGRHLQAVAAACPQADPIRGIKEEWYRLFALDDKARFRGRFSVLKRNRIPAAIELAERVRRLLAATGREQVDVDETAATVVKKAAAVVHQRSVNRLESLAAYLDNAVHSSFLDSGYEKVIGDAASKIWRHLRETAATEGEDSAPQELLGRWQKLYQIRSYRAQVDIEKLVREEGRVALALAQETREFLVSRRPDGA